MPSIVWMPEALADLMRHFDYLKPINPQAAGQVAQAIREAGFGLVNYPYRGLLLNDGSDRRKLRIPYGRVGYVMHYLIEDDTIVIVRIYNGREDRPT
jgi:plasmid stabilization system protein ParE